MKRPRPPYRGSARRRPGQRGAVDVADEEEVEYPENHKRVHDHRPCKFPCVSAVDGVTEDAAPARADGLQADGSGRVAADVAMPLRRSIRRGRIRTRRGNRRPNRRADISTACAGFWPFIRVSSGPDPYAPHFDRRAHHILTKSQFQTCRAPLRPAHMLYRRDSKRPDAECGRLPARKSCTLKLRSSSY